MRNVMRKNCPFAYDIHKVAREGRLRVSAAGEEFTEAECEQCEAQVAELKPIVIHSKQGIELIVGSRDLAKMHWVPLEIKQKSRPRRTAHPLCVSNVLTVK